MKEVNADVCEKRFACCDVGALEAVGDERTHSDGRDGTVCLLPPCVSSG